MSWFENFGKLSKLGHLGRKLTHGNFISKNLHCSFTCHEKPLLRVVKMRPPPAKKTSSFPWICFGVSHRLCVLNIYFSWCENSTKLRRIRQICEHWLAPWISKKMSVVKKCFRTLVIVIMSVVLNRSVYWFSNVFFVFSIIVIFVRIYVNSSWKPMALWMYEFLLFFLRFDWKVLSLF